MSKYVQLLIASLLLWTGAAQAFPVVFTADMSGAAEVPPVATTGEGFATVTYDAAAHTLLVDVDFQNLLGDTTAAHIHCCTPPSGNAGVATQLPTFSGFPTGVSAGSYTNLFDLTLASSFNAGFITASGGTVAAAESTLAAGLFAGEAYFNIHTDMFPGGEIRGNLTAVPEPASVLLLGLGFGALVAGRRRRSAR